MGLPPSATSWMFGQSVPLWVFILALLTSPSRWSDAVTTAARKRFGGQQKK